MNKLTKHWNGDAILLMKFPPLNAPEVVILTTSGAAKNSPTWPNGRPFSSSTKAAQQMPGKTTSDDNIPWKFRKSDFSKNIFRKLSGRRCHVIRILGAMGMNYEGDVTLSQALIATQLSDEASDRKCHENDIFDSVEVYGGTNSC